MECVKCGHKIMEGAAFCPYCGEKVAGKMPGEDKPIYTANVKGARKSGSLVVYRDRTEFVTSSVQKTIFNYSALVAVKKRLGVSAGLGLGLGLDHIDFITEDGSTESCPANRKDIHEAFLRIEEAVRPYIAERKERLLSQGIHYSFVSKMGTTGGILNISSDKAEFTSRPGQSEILSFQDVKSVEIFKGIGSETLEFTLIDGTSKSYGLDKEIRDEVLSFVKEAIKPYIAKRKAELLEQGIYFSFLNGQGSDKGTVDFFEDRVECRVKSGQSTVFFRDVRAASLYAGTLELGLTDGTSKSFVVDLDARDEVLAFVENAIKPYVMQRTVGYETAFGVDEQIEVNEQRSVFHILRQGGKEISEEFPLEALVKCEQTECTESSGVLDSVVLGSIDIFNRAATAVGAQNASNTEEKISYVGVLLTLRTEAGEQTQLVRFGNFPLRVSRTNKKYERATAETTKYIEYLSNECPECECIVPTLSEPEIVPEETERASAVITAGAVGGEEILKTTDAAMEKDEFGIVKYIAGVSRFIDECQTPMTIAIQGSRGSGKNSIMKMLSDSLEGRYPENRIWFNTRLLFQSNSTDPLSMLVGKGLIRQLSGAENGVSKDSAVKIAKGIIELLAGVIAPDTSAGKHLVEGIFKDGSEISPEELVKIFSELVKKRANRENGKFIIFMDDLDRLAPAKAVELLEALRNFSDCDGCVFVIAIDYSVFQRGVNKNHGLNSDENQEKALFDEIFQMSFRVPASGYHIENYVKDKLEHMEIYTDDETEIGFYAGLIQHSVGSDPKSMDRLFNSFLLLKNMAGRELYESEVRRLILFALLCMQTRFHSVYDQLMRMKDRITPELLSGLSGEDSEVLAEAGLSGEEKAQFCDFSRVFCDIIDSDDKEEISGAECSVFAEVLEFSGITSK